MHVELPTFHDAQFLGVSVSPAGDELVLNLMADGQNTAVAFSGLKAFRLVDMQIQNIVNRLHVHRDPGVGGEKLAELLRWVSSSVDAKPYMSDEEISRYAAKIERGELTLVRVEPSAGAELIFLCEAVGALEQVAV